MMSDERLAEIHHIVDTVNDFYGSRLARELLAEVERLRAREAALVAVVKGVAAAAVVMRERRPPLLFSVKPNLAELREQASTLLAASDDDGAGE